MSLLSSNHLISDDNFEHERPIRVQVSRLRSPIRIFNRRILDCQDQKFHRAINEDSDLTVQMHMLIWVFFRRSCPKERLFLITIHL